VKRVAQQELGDALLQRLEVPGPLHRHRLLAVGGDRLRFLAPITAPTPAAAGDAVLADDGRVAHPFSPAGPMTALPKLAGSAACVARGALAPQRAGVLQRPPPGR
jgi:hypothetical protein